jgi:hypothetical protein
MQWAIGHGRRCAICASWVSHVDVILLRAAIVLVAAVVLTPLVAHAYARRGAHAQDGADPREESLRAGDRQHALRRTLLIRAPLTPGDPPV